MKKELVIKLLKEIEAEGRDISGMICEEGIMAANWGIVEWKFFDDIDDSEIKGYLYDYVEEMEELDKDI